MKDFLSPTEAAARLTVNLKTLREWHASGRFPASHVSPSGLRRYRPEDVDRMRDVVDRERKSGPQKLCPTCGVAKAHHEFSLDGRTRDGLRSKCRTCRTGEGRAAKLTRLQREIDLVEGQKDCKQCGLRKPFSHYSADRRNKFHGLQGVCSSCKSENYYAGRDRAVDLTLRKKYGISLATYRSLHTQQGSACAVCRKAETSTTREGEVRSLAVDHCHTTGRVRGLLCAKCNKGIGLLRDDPKLLEEAANYLRKHA